MKYTHNKQSGFSLIEVLVSVMIISILTLGIYSLIILSLRINIDNGNYVIATELANQKMEQIRNLPYIDVGTLAGNPGGNIPDSETIFRDGEFQVNTSIRYEQDPYDGLVPPADIVFDDYKIATIEVVWNSKSGPKSVSVFSKIIPCTEETDSGNGLLDILVVDANGNPVATASVHIVNNIIAPAYDQTFFTDSNGELLRSVLPSFEGYEITVTKTGYGTDKTHTRNAENPNPTKPHLSVVVGDKTEESFSIDLLSILTINTINQDLPDNWQANTDTSGESQTNSRLIIDNSGFVYVVWEDYRQSSQSKIMAQKYSSVGDPQWPNPALPDEIFVSTANNTVLPDILVDSLGNLYIAWHDNSVGNQEVYLIRLDSVDGSDNWGGEKKLNTLADPDDQGEIRIALYESYGATTVTAVWQDDRNTANNNDIYLQQFDYSGSQILTPEIRVNQNLITDTTEQYDPAIEADSNGNTYAVWTDDRDGDLNIYGAKHNSSAVLQWELKLVSEAGNASQYESAIDIDS
ncbi:MAG: prepilin-type N-terminal cleavage/methylation domain-containing protein, partial [Elusimicrobiales bacterium]|nr:prepilin-type N-terminal cleavage/methylation domain-containing protein [Elusimicrobiales bacterium]